MDTASHSDHKSQFTAFLDTQHRGEYDQQIREMAKAADGRTSQRLLVSVNDIRQFDPKLATQLLRQPLRFLAPWTEVVTERVQYATGKKNTSESISLAARTHLGFIGTFGSHQVSPRELRASQLGTMVCVEGVITRCSITRPKVVRSVHWCASTQQHITREYRDSTALDMNIVAVVNAETESKDNPKIHPLQASRSSPSSDADGNILETEFGLSVYKDHQCVTILEPPESAPLGQLPRSVIYRCAQSKGTVMFCV